MNRYDEWLGVARLAAERAGTVIASFMADGFGVQHKADGSPVTEADVAAEKAIIETIREYYPDHAVYGEETGRHGDADVLWLIDPIDGTKSFVRGYPFFSTQIAVMERGQLVAGVSAAEHYHQTAWSTVTGEPFMNGSLLAVSAIERIEQASISTGNIASLAKSSQWNALGKVLSQASRTRGYGDFLHYHMLAAGQIDAVIESDVNILDIAALKVIVEAAGGRFTDLSGQALTLETRSALAAPPALHEKLLAELNA